MSGIMLGNSPAKLYLGDILLTGGGGYTDEDIVEMSWKILAESYTPTFAVLSKAETPYASYWRCWSDVAWNMELVPYDYTENFTKVYAKMRASTLYNNQGSYSRSTLTPPILIPNSTSNSKWLQMGEHLTVPCKFEVKNLTNMSACHPAISSRYTLTDGGWYDFTDDEWDFPDLITLGDLTASSQLMIVKFYSGTVYAFTYPNGVTPAITDDGTNYNIENIASRATISDLFNTAYTAKITPSYTTGAGFYMGKDAVNNVVMASTFDLVCNGVTIFAKNADITDFVAT